VRIYRSTLRPTDFRLLQTSRSGPRIG